jgi:hypothetical protein
MMDSIIESDNVACFGNDAAVIGGMQEGMEGRCGV